MCRGRQGVVVLCACSEAGIFPNTLTNITKMGSEETGGRGYLLESRIVHGEFVLVVCSTANLHDTFVMRHPPPDFGIISVITIIVALVTLILIIILV